jgi:hypothetical protein
VTPDRGVGHSLLPYLSRSRADKPAKFLLAFAAIIGLASTFLAAVWMYDEYVYIPTNYKAAAEAVNNFASTLRSLKECDNNTAGIIDATWKAIDNFDYPPKWKEKIRQEFSAGLSETRLPSSGEYDYKFCSYLFDEATLQERLVEALIRTSSQ